MKVLLVNKFHWNKGGSEKYYFELGQLLKEHGHKVAYFSMEDERNIKTGDKEYFVQKFDLNTSSKLKAFDVIYNKENEKIMEKALDEFQPDIVHLNNFQRQLSASILRPIKKRNIPIVFTAHDVQAICPAITMQDSDSKICELCIGGKYTNCIRKKCIKNSMAKSILGTIESYYYRLKKIYINSIDCIITPSNFVKNKFINDGISKEKIITLPNYVEVNEYNVKTDDMGYAFFFGRLSKEKGIINLIHAFSKCKRGSLYIAGEGPERENIEKIIRENNLTNKVKLLGFLDKNSIIEKISHCKFIVIPSTCNENCPYSIIESMAVGKPIVGSNSGGIPELIIDGINGKIYEANNIKQLTKILDEFFSDNNMIRKYSSASKKIAKEKYDKENYYKSLIKIYLGLLEKSKDV